MEELDSKRHTDQDLTALRIQILEERFLDSARAYCDPEVARHFLELDEKKLRDFEIFFRHLQEKHQVPGPRVPVQTNGRRSALEMDVRALCTVGKEFLGNQATVVMERND